MCESDSREIGAIGWADITVPDAGGLMEFYRDVAGVKVEGFDMGGYQDYTLHTPGVGRRVAGICHARGGNADLPPVWLLYFNVEDLDRSIAELKNRGGELIGPVRVVDGQGRYQIFKDPIGAPAALFQSENPNWGHTHHPHDHDHDHHHHHHDHDHDHDD
jgi:uncharacterized protein